MNTYHPHHTKDLISDFDEEICIFHPPISLGEDLWGRRVATARFSRGVGGLIKNSQTRHNIETTISFLLSDRVVRKLHNLGVFTT